MIIFNRKGISIIKNLHNRGFVLYFNGLTNTVYNILLELLGRQYFFSIYGWKSNEKTHPFSW